MKCTKCEKDLEKDTFVYSIFAFNGYYCLKCAQELKRQFGFRYVRVSNIPYYTD